MEILGLPQWTLNARLEGDALEFSLGDGRRLVRRSRRPVDLLDKAGQSMQAAEFFGADIAEPLAESAPRVLNVQFEARLDSFDWEMLGIGTARLAEQFSVARQLVSSSESPPSADTVLAETLSVICVHGDVAQTHPRMHCLSVKLLSQGWARKDALTAHVIVLKGVTLADLIDGGGLPGQPCLLVLGWPQPMQHLTVALDHGAAVLGLEQDEDLEGATLDALLLQLGRGASVGEAVRWLYRRAAPARLGARLYGDAEMRFRPRAGSGLAPPGHESVV